MVGTLTSGPTRSMLRFCLRPGQSARTWVGLHPAATQEEFDALSKRAGALLVPVKVLGEVREQLQL